MSILENLENVISEMGMGQPALTRDRAASLTKEVAVQDVDTGKFLNLVNALETGVPEWSNNPSFMMRQKIQKDVVPMLKQPASKAEYGRDLEAVTQAKQNFLELAQNKKLKFVDAKEIKSDIGAYDVTSINTNDMEQ